ncbi:arylsulfatase [Acidobacteria bacterium AH-259-G07]|nr:arylsulfatase [Acidobacteria bacterium AH-259-G07]
MKHRQASPAHKALQLTLDVLQGVLAIGLLGMLLVQSSQAAPMLGSLTAESSLPAKPNILLILADDLGWSDIGAYGGEVSTPNLDRLAAEGIRFTQFHNTAKCFPSRASMLTGLYAQQCGMNDKPGSFKNSVTLGEVLRAAGYRTLMAGKHHGQENPVHRGFDRYYGLRDGASNHFNPGLRREGEGVPAHKTGHFFPRTWCFDDRVFAPYTPTEKDFYTTDYFTKYALEFLEEYEDEAKPIFLYLAYTAPHDPLQAWPEDIAKYRGKYMAGYEAIRKARYEQQRQMALIDETFPLSDPTYGDWESLSKEEKERQDTIMAVYAAMVDRIDQNIGKVLDKLQTMGELDNTLVLFASDNGCSAGGEPNPDRYNPGATTTGEIGSLTRWTKISRSWANVSNTPFRYFKVDSHKGGTCTPMIAWWPDGIEGKNRISHEVSHFIDFMPTLVEAAHAQYPDEFNGQRIPPMQGRSLLPIFRNEAPAQRGPLFWQYGKGKAVRNGHWRLVSDHNSPWELYDMRHDKTETINLAAKFPKIVRQLDSMYQSWVDEFRKSE